MRGGRPDLSRDEIDALLGGLTTAASQPPTYDELCEALRVFADRHRTDLVADIDAAVGSGDPDVAGRLLDELWTSVVRFNAEVLGDRLPSDLTDEELAQIDGRNPYFPLAETISEFVVSWVEHDIVDGWAPFTAALVAEWVVLMHVQWTDERHPQPMVDGPALVRYGASGGAVISWAAKMRGDTNMPHDRVAAGLRQAVLGRVRLFKPSSPKPGSSP